MAAKRKPCKAGKVRRAIKGGRKMCLPKKKAAGTKRAAPKRRRPRFSNLPPDLAKEVMAEEANRRAVMGPGLYRAFNAAVKRGPCSVSLSTERLRSLVKTAAARQLLNTELAHYSKRCMDSID